MNFSNYGIVCPACKNQIILHGDFVICQSCRLQYPLVHGIIDLRYPQVNDDLETATMAAQFDQSSFEELLSIMLSEHLLNAQMLKDTLAYYEDQIDRTRRMMDMFANTIAINFNYPNPIRVLDLGCGSGAGVIALSERFSQVIGLDSSLAQLLLAKKALDNTPISNYLLICGFANCLPFKDQSLDSIQALNVLEHVMTIEPVISEISRTLLHDGTFIADSRNRFDVFFPEPHTGIRFLGFLPQKIIPKFVLWRKKMQYEQTRLLSYGTIDKAMRKFFQGEYIITFPDVQAYRQPAWINHIVAFIKKIPFIKKFAIWIFPTHIVIGKKL
ncbi:MAG: methyltransferase domain-containing protein [Brevefilum sp.]|nr:methyltransferase domain-containing protein [Brevefilum sp.]